MNNTITQDDLLLFIYGETDPNRTVRIREALLRDPQLRELHKSLVSSIQMLEPEQFEPADTSLRIIMEESALSHPEEIY